ncbi:MAG: hypothetical protein RL613_146 [Fusobacteriota bacterium]|jgi:hypothetical protein
MVLQTSAALRVRTPRVKSITDAEGYLEILVCLFTGEIQLYNKDILKLVRSAQVSDSPKRTGVIFHAMDWILFGTDTGNVVAVDLGSLSVLNQILAYDYFIRKIVVNEKNKRFITVSDDNMANLWSLGKTISLVQRYKGKHFIIDACFCPTGHGQFITDGKLYLYSTLLYRMFEEDTKLKVPSMEDLLAGDENVFVDQRNTFVIGILRRW